MAKKRSRCASCSGVTRDRFRFSLGSLGPAFSWDFDIDRVRCAPVECLSAFTVVLRACREGGLEGETVGESLGSGRASASSGGERRDGNLRVRWPGLSLGTCSLMGIKDMLRATRARAYQ